MKKNSHHLYTNSTTVKKFSSPFPLDLGCHCCAGVCVLSEPLSPSLSLLPLVTFFLNANTVLTYLNAY